MSTALAVFSARSPKATDMLGMVAKRAYRIAGRGLVPEAAVPAFHESPQYEPAVVPGGFRRFVADSDYFAAAKPSTDVLVQGSAFSTRGPVRMIDTAVSVGPMRKRVRVWGERTIQVMAGGRVSFSSPEPFTGAPLTWDLAYGGRDVHAEGRLSNPQKAFERQSGSRRTLAYPPNRWGRGYFLNLDVDRLEGARAPRLEAAEAPIRPEQLLATDPSDWRQRPLAVCYAPVDCATFPRASFMLRAPGTPLDARVANCAPAGLSGARLQGGERVSLWNLHPKHELLEIDLPGERPTLLLEPPGCSIQVLPALLQTVLIEPAAERVTLTWAGTLDVCAPYPAEMCREMRKAVRWER